jgi:NADPH-dependent glutamate synthase beta subunit-like oxidoreductase
MIAISEGTMEFNHTGSWRYLRPVYQEKLAPCRHHCPAGTDIPRVLDLIGEKEFEKAYLLIKESNPLPAICGRVCYHPCQGLCTRIGLDAGVSVQALERFVSETCLDLPIELPSKPLRSEKIAIIGSGPAGLTCAYFLARNQFRVTIFEAEEQAGGMLRAGIPAYRLPRSILDREIRTIERLGIRFELGRHVGKDIPLHDLRDKYDALFVASGAHKSRSLKLDSCGGQRLLEGLAFLKAVNAGRPPSIGKSVVVIGGGNTAIDTARVAVRLGADAVIVYRRSRLEMPATEEEIKAAEEEGVSFVFLAAPTAVRQAGAKLDVEFQEMKLGVADSSGRRAPVPISGSLFKLEASCLIEAIGEEAELGFLPGGAAEPGVFIGGDAQTGPSTVIDAVAAGRKAAHELMEYLNGLGSTAIELPTILEPVSQDAINFQHFGLSATVMPRRLPVTNRISNFTEIVQTLTPEEAVYEARRCLSCGVCNECDACWVFCPETAISRSDGNYEINLDYCKGCGICAQECPRGVVSLFEEEQ